MKPLTHGNVRWQFGFGAEGQGRTLMSVSTLALVLQELGKHEEAERVHRRGLKGREKVLGQDALSPVPFSSFCSACRFICWASSHFCNISCWMLGAGVTLKGKHTPYKCTVRTPCGHGLLNSFATPGPVETLSTSGSEHVNLNSIENVR